MKDLKQIQEENRKVIISNIHPEYNESQISFLARHQDTTLHKSTLNRVLLALEKSFEGEDGCFGLNFHHGLFDYWWITLSKSSPGIIESWICKWDLDKQTLEQQTEETQRAIYKLLAIK